MKQLTIQKLSLFLFFPSVYIHRKKSAGKEKGNMGLKTLRNTKLNSISYISLHVFQCKNCPYKCHELEDISASLGVLLVFQYKCPTTNGIHTYVLRMVKFLNAKFYIHSNSKLHSMLRPDKVKSLPK